MEDITEQHESDKFSASKPRCVNGGSKSDEIGLVYENYDGTSSDV